LTTSIDYEKRNHNFHKEKEACRLPEPASCQLFDEEKDSQEFFREEHEFCMKKKLSPFWVFIGMILIVAIKIINSAFNLIKKLWNYKPS
jgi:hypothetical protein